MVKYTIIRHEEDDDAKDREVTFFPADFFSREIQHNVATEFGNSTAWHIPVSEWQEGGDRLCLMIIK